MKSCGSRNGYRLSRYNQITIDKLFIGEKPNSSQDKRILFGMGRDWHEIPLFKGKRFCRVKTPQLIRHLQNNSCLYIPFIYLDLHLFSLTWMSLSLHNHASQIVDYKEWVMLISLALGVHASYSCTTNTRHVCTYLLHFS